MRAFCRWSLLIVVAMLAASPVVRAQEVGHEYIASKNCKKCHFKQYKSWQETAMAQAFESLKPGVKAEAKTAAGLDPQADYTQDANCVRCHVTGWGEEGGFTALEETPDLAGVGCESCHGAGGTYVQEGYMTLKNKEYKLADLVAVGLVEKVSEAQCVKCHNEESPFYDASAPFDFETAKDEGTHEHYPLKYSH